MICGVGNVLMIEKRLVAGIGFEPPKAVEKM
jgi:hypothetical protein